MTEGAVFCCFICGFEHYVTVHVCICANNRILHV